jgi:hypothetical protein
MTKKFTAQGSCAVNSNNEVSLISFVNNKFGIRCTDLSLWSIRIKFTAFFVRIDWSTVSLHIFVILEELRREVKSDVRRLIPQLIDDREQVIATLVDRRS